MPDRAALDMAIYKRTRALLEAEIGDELVALDVASGDCFGFNEVARSVWRSLSEPKSFGQLCDELLAHYDVGIEQCRTELNELLDDLVAQGLIAKISK